MSKVFGKQKDYAPIKEEESRVIISYGYVGIDSKNATWYEVIFYKKQVSQVSLSVVKDSIIADINARTDEKILTGYVWDEKPVWLSGENQFNYKAVYDLAVQSKGANLPVTFKIGENESGEPVYHTFDKLADLKAFYEGAVSHVVTTLGDGWTEKDSIDWTPYEAFFNKGE